MQTLLTTNAEVVSAMATFIMSPARPDWPDAGPLDLTLHDLPHCSSATEWWYYNMHFSCSGQWRESCS